LRFDSSGFAKVSGWSTRQQSGNATLDRKSEDGKELLRINGDNGGCIASWRATVLLAPGKYRLQGQAKGLGISAQESEIGSGAGLRISGGKRSNKLAGDKDWTALEYEFEV